MLKVYIIQINSMNFGYANNANSVSSVGKSQATKDQRINVSNANANITANAEE